MRRSTIIAALLAFGLIAASCGGSESDSGVASLETPSQATDNQEQAQSDEAVAEPISDEEAILAFAALSQGRGRRRRRSHG